ncbi:MAG: hypothetical protein JHC31_15500 [Sulfurihydrogenibium sp.]|nr:hypothetical protein [Sulfurihydrogenibium sp.]
METAIIHYNQVLARVSGWFAHWKEYINRLTEIYIGEVNKKYNDRKV